MERFAGGSAGHFATADVFEAFAITRRLKAKLATMPEDERRAFDLLDVEGRSLREVAKIMGTTTTGAKASANRARTALRIALHDPESARQR
jgi:RNA polymerase sigma factor (sigma-70 family)